MGNKEPLDMSQFHESEYVDDSEGDYQLEIVTTTPKVETPKVNPKRRIPSQPNPKFEGLQDHELDDKIKAFRGHKNLPLSDCSVKIIKFIEDLEEEKLFRENREKIKEKVKLNQAAKEGVKGFSVNGDNRRPMSTRASYRNVNEIYSQTDCSGRHSKIYASDSPSYSEELVLVNHTKGKGPCTQRSPNTDGSTLDGGKDTSRVLSGNLAGPSPRLGLRSGSRQCHTCLEFGGNCTCGFYRKRPGYFTEKESPKRNPGLGPAPVRRANGIKRARQDGGGDSPEKVVELFSSEDEEDKEAQDTNADSQVASQRKAYGTRSTVSPSWEGLKIAYPSRDDPASVEVASHDLSRLAPLEFLNDTVIDFYIKYMQRPENLTEEHKSKFYFFNSFFYKKLSDIAGGQNKKTVADLSKLKRWTKGTNIFEKEYLFVPIHDKWHWSLAIVCHPGATSEDTGCERCILHLDSMSPGHKSNTVFRLLRTYLIAEWEHQADKDGQGGSCQKLSHEDFVVKKIPVPQQENESDCGLFLLHYIKLFLKDAPSAFKLSDVDKGRLFGRNWFIPSEASDLRRVIKKLLEEFFERESSRAKEKTQTIEKSLENGGSENRLQSDVHTHPSDVEVIDSVDSPGQSSPTELEHEQNMPDANIDFSSSGSTPKDLYSEQGPSNDVVKVDEDTPPYSEANCSDPRKSIELITSSMLGSSRVSVENTKTMEIINQFSKGNGDLDIGLIVDLSPCKSNKD